MRPADLLSRTGGDEFALLLPDTDFAASSQVLARLRDSFRAAMTQKSLPVTMSIGTVTFNVLPSSVEAMLKRADELMYEVKRAGKPQYEARGVAGKENRRDLAGPAV